jgi:transposase
MYMTPFREAVLRVYSFFGSMRKTAAICGVSVASVSRWSKQLAPKQRVARSVTLGDAIVESVGIFLRSRLCCSSLDVVQFIRETWRIDVSRQLAHCVIRRLGFTYKRTRKRGGGAVIRKATTEFLTAFQRAAAAGTLVSVDESGFDQRCRPVYGYAPSGSLAIAEVIPCRDRRRYNLLMALHASGSHVYTLRDVTTTGDAFADFLDSLPYPPATTLLLDNAAIHRTARVREVAGRKGYALLFTPAYSPEYNPIELVFGSIKNAFYRERYSPQFGHDLRGAVERCVALRATPQTVRGSFDHVARLVAVAAAS